MTVIDVATFVLNVSEIAAHSSLPPSLKLRRDRRNGDVETGVISSVCEKSVVVDRG